MTSRSTLKSGVVFAAAMFALVSASRAQNSGSVVDRLHRAITANSIDDAEVKPWHLKLSFQLFDEKGAATEKGSVEEWWAGPSTYKTVYTSPSYTSTEIQTADGLYRSKGASSAPVLLQLVRRQVVDPLPGEKEIADSKPDMQHHDFGPAKMDCIMLVQPIEKLVSPPLGLFPTYCFDRDQDALRISFEFGSQLTVRSKLGIFQGRKVAVDQTTRFGSVNAITALVDTLETVSISPSDLAPSAELIKVSSSPTPVAGDVMKGLKISGDLPIYPENAKRNHISGRVVLNARIGTDGRIRSLKVMSGPDPGLAISALTAVRSWTYKPFLLNGEPTEVDTTIAVNFNFGPAF
jgi:TonB family protein